jgi:hypothetical protein
MMCGLGARSGVPRKLPPAERPDGRSSGRGGEPREVYFELYPVGDSMKVSAVDGATGTEVSIVGPAKLPQAELERVALNKLRYVLKQKADLEDHSNADPKSGRGGKGWIV